MSTWFDVLCCLCRVKNIRCYRWSLSCGPKLVLWLLLFCSEDVSNSLSDSAIDWAYFWEFLYVVLLETLFPFIYLRDVVSRRLIWWAYGKNSPLGRARDGAGGWSIAWRHVLGWGREMRIMVLMGVEVWRREGVKEVWIGDDDDDGSGYKGLYFYSLAIEERGSIVYRDDWSEAGQREELTVDLNLRRWRPCWPSLVRKVWRSESCSECN